MNSAGGPEFTGNVHPPIILAAFADVGTEDTEGAMRCEDGWTLSTDSRLDLFLFFADGTRLL